MSTQHAACNQTCDGDGPIIRCPVCPLFFCMDCHKRKCPKCGWEKVQPMSARDYAKSAKPERYKS